MALVIMIRVNISDYREVLVCSCYHDNSLIKCTETWSLAQKPALELGSSLIWPVQILDFVCFEVVQSAESVYEAHDLILCDNFPEPSLLGKL